MQTFEECHKAGMTATEAAEALGKSDVAAYKWARKHGVSWARMNGAVRSAKIRAGLEKRKAEKGKPVVNGMGERRFAGQALPPEQERQGGAFWLQNNKTGERINCYSAAAVYRHAQLRGWVDWDWGRGN